MSLTPVQPDCTSIAAINAVSSAHAGKYETLLDMLGVTPPRADAGTCLLPGVIHYPAHLLRVQTRHAAAGRGGANRSDQVVRVPKHHLGAKVL